MARRAKNIDEALDNAIEELLKDTRGAMKKAVEYAVDQAEHDFMEKINSCLEQYYEWEPNAYERTRTLHNAFVPYRPKINYTGDRATGSVGVEYSVAKLEESIVNTSGETRKATSKSGMSERIVHVGYYGSAKHQPVDAWWVLENFLAGRHPDGGDDISSFYVGQKPPEEVMSEFRDNYDKTFDQNVLLSLLSQIAKNM